MDVRCEKCSTEYEFDENRIGANGVTVKCTACGFVFKVRRPSTAGRTSIPRPTTTIGKGPQGKEWLVKKPDGQMIAFRELTTLQKWIVEGRISREDEISKNGETWKRLGNILELEPFFSVYEKAQALNTNFGDAGRLELRGSEVLSAHGPMPTIGADVGPRSAMGAIPLGAEPRRTSAPPYQSAPAQTIPVPSLAPSAVPTSNNGHVPVRRPSIPPTPQPQRGPSARPPKDDSDLALDLTPPPPASSGLDRSLNLGSVQPASFGKDTLDLPINDRRRRDDAEDWQRSQRTSRIWLFAVLAVLAAAGGGIAAGIYGPEGNPIKELLIRYGLLAPAKDDGAYKLVEDAQRALDLDSIPSQQKASALLGQAHALRPKDPTIIAERAFFAAHSALTFQRWAEDLEAAATRAQVIIDKWKEQKKELGKAKPKDGEPPVELPPRPSTPDPKDLLALANEKRDAMGTALKEAEDLIAVAEKLDPGALETSRAEAAVRLVKKDSVALAEALGRAKTSIEKNGRADAATLYLEAASVYSANPADLPSLDRVLALTDQALTTRPTLLRARALEARARLQKSDLDGAQRALDLVLRTAPDHEEARRLLDEQHLLVRQKEEAEKAKKALEPPPPPPAAETPGVEEVPGERPKDFEFYMQQGDRLRERDRTRQALNAYGRAAELKPDSAEVHTGKGWCFLDLEKPRLALTAFERALVANDKYIDAYYGLAEAHRALGDKAQAISAYEKYLSRAPEGTPERRAVQRTLDELKR